jgi:hypothetical protein
MRLASTKTSQKDVKWKNSTNFLASTSLSNILRWLDTIFKNSGVQHFDMFKLRIFRIFSADIFSSFLYIMITLLSNYISFVAMTTFVYEIHSKMVYRLV